MEIKRVHAPLGDRQPSLRWYTLSLFKIRNMRVRCITLCQKIIRPKNSEANTKRVEPFLALKKSSAEMHVSIYIHTEIKQKSFVIL